MDKTEKGLWMMAAVGIFGALLGASALILIAVIVRWMMK